MMAAREKIGFEVSGDWEYIANEHQSCVENSLLLSTPLLYPHITQNEFWKRKPACNNNAIILWRLYHTIPNSTLLTTCATSKRECSIKYDKKTESCNNSLVFMRSYTSSKYLEQRARLFSRVATFGATVYEHRKDAITKWDNDVNSGRFSRQHGVSLHHCDQYRKQIKKRSQYVAASLPVSMVYGLST